MKYDLEERTIRFGQQVVEFSRSLHVDHVSRPLVSQFVRSGTSVGANYHEANGASSRKDFRNKIFICKKEIQETDYWIKMLRTCIIGHDGVFKILEKECRELTLIFQKIGSTLND